MLERWDLDGGGGSSPLGPVPVSLSHQEGPTGSYDTATQTIQTNITNTVSQRLESYKLYGRVPICPIGLKFLFIRLSVGLFSLGLGARLNKLFGKKCTLNTNVQGVSTKWKNDISILIPLIQNLSEISEKCHLHQTFFGKTLSYSYHLCRILESGGNFALFSSFNGKFNKKTLLYLMIFSYDKQFLRKMQLSNVLSRFFESSNLVHQISAYNFY